jgi:hypothetical protein
MAQYKEITMNGKYALVVEGAKKKLPGAHAYA